MQAITHSPTGWDFPYWFCQRWFGLQGPLDERTALATINYWGAQETKRRTGESGKGGENRRSRRDGVKGRRQESRARLKDGYIFSTMVAKLSSRCPRSVNHKVRNLFSGARKSPQNNSRSRAHGHTPGPVQSKGRMLPNLNNTDIRQQHCALWNVPSVPVWWVFVWRKTWCKLWSIMCLF